jgi:hypothetical protein
MSSLIQSAVQIISLYLKHGLSQVNLANSLRFGEEKVNHSGGYPLGGLSLKGLNFCTMKRARLLHVYSQYIAVHI